MWLELVLVLLIVIFEIIIRSYLKKLFVYKRLSNSKKIDILINLVNLESTKNNNKNKSKKLIIDAEKLKIYR